MRRYPWEHPIGVIFSGVLFGNYDQSWSESRSRNEERDPGGSALVARSSRQQAWDYLYLANVTGALGIGKVRDATGVHRARLLEWRLQKDGVLAHPLSPGARARLARLYYLEPAYGYPHDQPAKYFWRELASLLEEEGALGYQGLDAYAIFHALEPYAYGSSTADVARPQGYFVGLAVSADHRQFILRADSDQRTTQFFDDTLSDVAWAFGSRTETNDDLVMVGGRAEYHAALGFRTQWDARGSALFDVKDARRGMSVFSSLHFACFLEERWSAEAFADQSRGITPGADRPMVGPSITGAVWATTSRIARASASRCFTRISPRTSRRWADA
ncbi:MAG TPA: hypothetical protein VGK93_06015 [Candidatus Eisenbacteria bacterium]|jgi:hypothetical protein